jgi:hypothetical protein
MADQIASPRKRLLSELDDTAKMAENRVPNRRRG